MEKIYLVPESDLRSILYGALTFNALANSGVIVNWENYDDSISNFISTWKKDKNIPTNEEIYIEDIVEDQMQYFNKAKE